MPLALSFLMNSSSTKVLAAPRLQLLNQKKASILIGDKIPLELKTAAQTAQGSINLATSVQYTNVGIQLDVEVLQIHPTQEVTLALIFDVSSVVSFSPAGYPRTSNRNANSVVRLRDGETIVLGGLINDSEQSSLAKVPLVGELPLIGKLFRRERSEVLTREIVMTVTPRIIDEERALEASGEKDPRTRSVLPGEAPGKAGTRGGPDRPEATGGKPAAAGPDRRFERLLRGKGLAR
ncbi:MAG: type II and III secretion system protein [Candidatus Wallbacteria bacterium]|nr:type II and III secretion system protein [Candidatus Wallbacteria bacterium]